jgi:hypothetical protein
VDILPHDRTHDPHDETDQEPMRRGFRARAIRAHMKHQHAEQARAARAAAERLAHAQDEIRMRLEQLAVAGADVRWDPDPDGGLVMAEIDGVRFMYEPERQIVLAVVRCDQCQHPRYAEATTLAAIGNLLQQACWGCGSSPTSPDGGSPPPSGTCVDHEEA